MARRNGVVLVTPSPIHRGTRYCFRSIFLFVYLFISFFVYILVSLLARLRERLDRFAQNVHGRCGVIMGQRDLIFGQFGETTRCRDANFFVSNITSKPLDQFAWNSQGRCGVTIVRPDYIFGQFRETARCRDTQHGEGVCCAFAPQLVVLVLVLLWVVLVIGFSNP